MVVKRILQVFVFAMALLAVALCGSLGCSNDKKEPQKSITAPQDVPILTSSEAASVVYQYLDVRLKDGTPRGWLTQWGGKSGATYAGNHTWNVQTTGLGTWSLYERTSAVTPADETAQRIARLWFK